MTAGDLIRSLHPIRDGSDIYVEAGGERIKLSPMQTNLILQAWAEAVGGAMVLCATAAEGINQKDPPPKRGQFVI